MELVPNVHMASLLVLTIVIVPGESAMLTESGVVYILSEPKSYMTICWDIVLRDRTYNGAPYNFNSGPVNYTHHATFTFQAL